jgi:VanZ family protein
MSIDGRRSIPFPDGPLPEPWPRLFAGAAAAYTAVLLYATHHPRPGELVGVPLPADKTLHFVAYGLLGAAVGGAVAARGGWGARAAAAWLVGLAVFAALDEATQPFFGRYADVRDWMFDGIGLVVGVAAVSLVVALARHRPRARGQ